MDITYLDTKNKLKFEIDDTDYFTQLYDIVIEEPVKEEITIENEVLQRVTPSTFTTLHTDYDRLSIESTRLCSICDKIFPNSFTFLQHNIAHIEVPLTKLEVFICDRCTQNFRTIGDLEDHIRSQHLKLPPNQDQLQKCNICNKVYSRKYIHSHMKEVHGTIKLKCSICNKMFKSAITLKRHKIFMHDKVYKPWRYRLKHPQQLLECDILVQCKLCPKMLNKYSILTHMKNCHGNEEECEICKKKFKCKPYLNTHMQRVHVPDGQEFACDICGKVLKSKRRITIHKKNSQEEGLKVEFHIKDVFGTNQ